METFMMEYTEIDIRAIDTNSIVDLHCRSFMHSHSHLGVSPDPAELFGYWSRIARTESKMFIAKRGDMITGFAVLSPTRIQNTTGGEIRALYVDPQHLRQGIGTKLLDLAAASARRSGWSVLYILVVAGNTTEEFYRCSGLTFIGEHATTMKGTSMKIHTYQLSLD